MKYILGLLLLILSATLNGAETFIVGTNTDFPPFSYLEKGQIVGFDIDIAKEVAKRLEKEIIWKDMPFEALIPAITLKQVDFVAAGMSATEERSKRMLFTKSYVQEDPLVAFTLGDKGFALEDLQGKTVTVVEGFTADLFMSDKKGIDLVRLPTQADAFIAIKSGRAQVFVTAKSTVDAFVKAQKIENYQAIKISGTGETCAIVLPKSSTALLDSIQGALDAMEADGTIKNLKTKWKLL